MYKSTMWKTANIRCRIFQTYIYSPPYVHSFNTNRPDSGPWQTFLWSTRTFSNWFTRGLMEHTVNGKKVDTHSVQK